MNDPIVRVSKRRAKADATRARIIASAYALLCELGYRGTTMAMIGERAGVAVQTVYFTFHTKDRLLQAVHEWTVLGDDPTPPALQDWHVAALQQPTADAALRQIIEGIASINARVAPMLPVFGTLEGEPAGALYQHSQDLRRKDMSRLVDVLAKKTPLAKRVSRRRAAELLHFLTGPESYRSLVLETGWPPQTWCRWVGDILCRELFDTPW